MNNWLTQQDQTLRKQALTIVGSAGIIGILFLIIWFYTGMGLY